MLGDHFASPVFAAALELWVAARTDAALLAAVEPLEQRVGREAHRMTVAALGADESRPGVRELVQATLDLVRGLGLASTISDDSARRRRILREWADISTRSCGPDMTDVLTQVLADLAAEGDRLDALVTDLDDAGWHTPTPGPRLGRRHPGRAPRLDRRRGAEGRDRQGRVGRGRAGRDRRPGGLRRRSRRSRSRPSPTCWSAGGPPGADLRKALAAHPRGEKMPWFGPPMSATSMATARLMETWAHSLDVHEGLGAPVEDTDRIRHVAHLGVRTRNFAYAVHGLDAPGRGVPHRPRRAVRRRLELGSRGRRPDR